MTSSTSKQHPLTCSGHTRPVVDIQFSNIIDDEYYLVSACKDGKPMLRNGKTGDWIGTFEGHKGAVWSATINEDTSKVLTGSADFTAKLFDAYNGNELQSYQHNHIVRSVAFSPFNHNNIVTGGHEKIIRLWDINSPDVSTAQTIGDKIEDSGPIKCLAWLSQNTILGIREGESVIRCYDERTAKEVIQLSGPIADVTSNHMTNFTLSWDRKLIIGTSGKSILLWNAEDFTLVNTIQTSFNVSSAHIHPTSPILVASGSEDLWVHVFDTSSNTEIDVFKGHHGPVHTVAFSPDGQIYASGSEDGTIRLWQTQPGTVYGLWQPRVKAETPSTVSSNNETVEPVSVKS
ncbi:WD40-repeat-containing domain protein [Paraphysoderma sedebokerense]|nr:WD40-repeat-containing domain protein [Paraphysoderma sedebokerense]